MYLNLSSPIFSSITTGFLDGTKKIGAYETVPQVTDSNGYAWDIVGLNESGSSKGVTTPTGNVTLLLSQTSSKKVEGLYSGYAGKIYDYFDKTTSTNLYKDSTLSKVMSSFYTQLQSDGDYQITERTLTGGSSNPGFANYNDDYIAGETISNQGVWPLSFKESEQLDLRTRLFPTPWWLRSPGSSDSCAVRVSDNGYVNPYGDFVYYYYYALRPALYINLSSPILQNNINSGQLSANWKTEMPDSNVEVPFAQVPTVPVSKVAVTPAVATLTAGKTKQLSVAVSPSNATNKSVTWGSSNTKVATVSFGGKVTAKAVGTVTIIVMSKASSSKTAKSVVTVKAKVKNPKKFKINSITVGKKKSKALTVKWTKQGSKKLTKVQLRYRVKGTSKWKTIAISPNAKSKAIKKLKVGKKYQFQIRGYKKVSGKKYCSGWSVTKTSGKVR